jgi:callose synthase
MADELHDLLIGKKFTTAYKGGSESFLRNVVTPIYRVIYEVYSYFLYILVNISI